MSCIINDKVFHPLEYKVLVRPDLIEETDETIKRCKALGIEMPESEKLRDQLKQITGVLVAIGGKSFEDFGDPTPAIGQRVYFAKYAGIMIEADDKTEYRLMSDKDITALLI